MINLYSVLHLLVWLAAGRLILTSWLLFLFIAVGWEGIELLFPLEFAQETWANKAADLVLNCIGFWIGLRWRAVAQRASTSEETNR